jgi:hypothetical protein
MSIPADTSKYFHGKSGKTLCFNATAKAPSINKTSNNTCTTKPHLIAYFGMSASPIFSIHKAVPPRYNQPKNKAPQPKRKPTIANSFLLPDQIE